MGTATAGNLGTDPDGDRQRRRERHQPVRRSSIADGSVLTATTTVESSMGSFHMTHGFLLNNQLTDFSATPTDATGALIANRVAPLKRPRSSMAPTLVFRMAADGSKRRLLHGDRIAGRRHDSAVRAEDAGRRARLGPRCAAVVRPDRLRRQQRPDDDDRRRAPQRQYRQQRRQRSAHHRPARARPHDLDRGAIERRQLGHAGASRAAAPALAGGTDPRREGVVLGDTFVPEDLAPWRARSPSLGRGRSDTRAAPLIRLRSATTWNKSRPASVNLAQRLVREQTVAA